MKIPWKSTEEIKRVFLDYFLAKDHKFIEPSGIVPKNDPTLMLINSGMAPMKPYFTGQKVAPYPRLTNIQDCIRFTDFDSVGDSSHGTSFRMMGSWSFGDYFKERAIELAFELLTGQFGIPAERLSATVFVADESLPGVPSDEESMRIWERFLPRSRIFGRPPADNFWGPAGTSGPCGPCTEVFFDRGEEFAEKETDDVLVPGRHIEIWNAGVFTQYFKDEEGKFSPLPMKCVDTGAGLERFALVLQDCTSIYQIDQYVSSYQLINQCLGDVTWTRIVFDHLKTSILMIREGIIPSNTQEGYLLRRALRRAMTGMFLRGISLDLLQTWVDSLSDVIDNKELTSSQKPVIAHWLGKEREGFEGLMRRSKKHLDKVETSKELDAQHAFSLKTSLGISEDFLEEFCVRHSILFPKVEFLRLIEEHKEISRQSKK
jgi:alanyl-tRNA synthetase